MGGTPSGKQGDHHKVGLGTKRCSIKKAGGHHQGSQDHHQRDHHTKNLGNTTKESQGTTRWPDGPPLEGTCLDCPASQDTKKSLY